MRGRNTALYRMRARTLALLARMLHQAGPTATVAEPDAMPVLRIPRPGRPDEEIVATLGCGEVDWFRWHGGDFIAPCSEPETACEHVLRKLYPHPPTRAC